MRAGSLPNLSLSALAGSVLAFTLTSAAWAQDNDTDDPAEAIADEVIVLDTVEIFGTPNAETRDETTTSVVVISEDAIQDYGVRSLDEAFGLMGNVSSSTTANTGFRIRGINAEGFTPGAAPLATLYIDGVPQTTLGARRGAHGAWDVEQIEVYRGPMSTLQGRAALAGSVYIRSAEPVFFTEGRLQTGVGTNDAYRGAFMFNTPIVDDQVAIRLSGEYETSESDIGYGSYEGLSGFDDFVESEYYQLRGRVLIEPEALPDTRALLTYSFAHDAPDYHTIGGPGATVGQLGAPTYELGEERGDIWFPLYQYEEDRSADNHNVGVEITHDFNDQLSVKSISTFTRNVTDRSSINAGAPFDETAFLTALATTCLNPASADYLECMKDPSVEGEQIGQLFTQEFRARYETEGLRVVGGLYFADESLVATRFANADVTTLFMGQPAVQRYTDSDTDSLNLAGYGEANWEFAPAWHVIAGGRVDYNDHSTSITITERQLNGVATANTTFFESASSEVVFLPRLGLIYELDDQHSLGLTYQQGYRTGGVGISASGNTYTYDPEFTSNYELSYRGNFPELDLTVFANAFYQNWKDQQIESYLTPNDPTTSVVQNAGKSTSFGFEFDARLQATDELSLFTSVGYVDTQIDEFVHPTLGDLSGSAFPGASKWTVGAGAAYRHMSGVYASANAKYSDGWLSALGGDRTDSHVVVDGQIGFEYENFSIELYGDNVFNEDYYDSYSNGVSAVLGEPAEYGVRLALEF